MTGSIFLRLNYIRWNPPFSLGSWGFSSPVWQEFEFWRHPPPPAGQPPPMKDSAAEVGDRNSRRHRCGASAVLSQLLFGVLLFRQVGDLPSALRSSDTFQNLSGSRRNEAVSSRLKTSFARVTWRTEPALPPRAFFWWFDISQKIKVTVSSELRVIPRR